MDHSTNLILIDSNTRRRAVICHTLSGFGLHVEPFEDVHEFMVARATAGVVFAEDADGNIPNLLDHMTNTGNWLPVIGFSEKPATHRIVRAIHEGAVDYLQWPCDAETVRAVISAAQACAAELGSHKLREAQARSRIQRLTRREREVLAGVAGGLSNRLIGQRLAISPRTVEIHRANMLDKIGANHTSEAIRIAIEAALMA